MADLINLRTVRKKKRREQKEKRARANRVLFGRTRQEKEAQAKSALRTRRNLDDHKREK